MNPTITEAFIEAEIERDPVAARSEWLAQFREDIEAAFSLESIETCVIPGRTELLPATHLSYSAFVDPSAEEGIGSRSVSLTEAAIRRSSISFALGNRRSILVKWSRNVP